MTHQPETARELASLAANAGRALQDEKRHYEIACQENARLRAALARVRALADEYATSDERWRPSARLTGQVFRRALDGTAAPTAVSAAVTPPTNRAALRDRIRRAICEAEGFMWNEELLEPDEYGEVADAVLAVLPSAADWDALVREADRLRRDGAALHARAEELDMQLAALRQQVTEPTDRAAVLSAAERAMLTYALDQAQEHIWSRDGFTDEDQAAVDSLRRMADETATQTPFTPPAHYRRDDGVDCCVHAIPVGPDSCQACRELANDEPASGPTIVDQVVAALQAKAQALSVEAEEEMRRDLEEQAQVWHEAADLARRTARKAARSDQPAAGARQDGAET
ncbi:hypothetical protein ABT320_01540 [Streptomyces cellulosae]